MHQKHNRLLQQELLKTLAYSDTFSYPLTGDQLFQFCPIPMSRKDFFSVIPTLPHLIFNNTIYYFLPRKKYIVMDRIKKETISKKKLIRLKKIVKVLEIIPTICFIGVSGSLAMRAADKKSDSDIFIIAKSHTVWLTRFFVYILLLLLGVKRKNNNTGMAICANMFVAENALQFPKGKRNLYSAHEIMQLMPMSNKQKTFEKFLLSNKWIRTYFPNFVLPKVKKGKSIFSFWICLAPFDSLFRLLQVWYMRKKITRETVEKNFIAFHPIDYERIILRKYKKRLKVLRI